MVVRKFIVEHIGSDFDVDYDTDDGFEVLKFQLFSFTSVPPDQQKVGWAVYFDEGWGAAREEVPMQERHYVISIWATNRRGRVFFVEGVEDLWEVGRMETGICLESKTASLGGGKMGKGHLLGIVNGVGLLRGWEIFRKWAVCTIGLIHGLVVLGDDVMPHHVDYVAA